MNVYMRVFFLQFQCFVNLKFKIFIFLQLLTKVYNFFMLLELRVLVPCRKSLYNWCNFIISIYIPDAIIYLRLYVVLKCCKKGIGTTVITLWVFLLTTNQRSSSESCVCDCQLWEIDFVSILINSDCLKGQTITNSTIVAEFKGIPWALYLSTFKKLWVFVFR